MKTLSKRGYRRHLKTLREKEAAQDGRDIARLTERGGDIIAKGPTRSSGRALTRYRRDLGFEGFKSYTPALCVRPMKSWVRI